MMAANDSQDGEHRNRRRLALQAMYTHVRVRPRGTRLYRWSGHIYDVSESGMRMELDEQVEDGTNVEISAALPGKRATIIRARGTIVRRHDDDAEPGPVRLGVSFDTFTRRNDRRRLADYVSQHLAA
jgi:hypothetical protein